MDDDERKAEVARVFSATVGDYDRVGTPLFVPLGRRLVELAGLAPGARVLDVATGTGAVLVPAAEAAGPSGHVLGIDLSAEMVHAAAAAPRPPGSAPVETRVMDAESLDHLPDAGFDAVLCGCALSFLPHPDRAAAEFLRVLRPGCTVAVSRWSEADERWEWYGELLERHGVRARRLMAGSPQPEALLAGAGFRDPSTTTERFELAFADAAEWWRWLWAMPYRAALEDLPPDVLDRLRQAAFERLAEVNPEGPVALRAEARYVVGRRPPSPAGGRGERQSGPANSRQERFSAARR